MTAIPRPLPGWKVVDAHHLERTYELRDFAQALALANRIGAAAEEMNHHPELTITWGELRVKLWTHSVDGLTPKDDLLASRIEEEAQRLMASEPRDDA